MYEKGYVFTRLNKGAMHQTRSVRIDLSKFELSSENRRILKKTGGVMLSMHSVPFADYSHAIGKLAKDFYDTKFGPGIMSAQKIKEMLTDPVKSNFNALFSYVCRTLQGNITGYSICYATSSFLHYSYPFYELHAFAKDMGLGMMIQTIQYAKESGMKYIYLGSLQRPGDTYKLQFSGLEWFDGMAWSSDLEKAKKELIPTISTEAGIIKS